MIDLSAAEALLDFGSRLGPGSEERAREQLEGAVAIANILHKYGVAYLADEVGMGKTYVALGAVALFRHLNPNFRVLVIAPRGNIQKKWRKEMRNFVEYNVRHSDMRVRGLDGSPARPLVSCERLFDFLEESLLDPDRDFFLRLTSFSMGMAGRDEVDPEQARALRNAIRSRLPWLSDEVLDLRKKQDLKDNLARALCCGLPEFDLVIVDEGHNLKQGFGEHVSARNRVMGLAFGHPSERPKRSLFPRYGPRAKRVLFLSATPIEETYLHLWNQLNVFGKAGPFDELRRGDVSDERKKAVAAQFLVRRVTAMRIGGEEWTKNLYRREWRAGGVDQHDNPIRVQDDRQKLVVALVQKKVAEVLGHERFNRSFQIGMLASFESFLQTARLIRKEDEVVFDDPDQTDDDLEREGVDVRPLNRLARSYRQTFGEELPHPKMDAVVLSLADAWRQGRKTLVFVRRVASVKELKRKLDDCYDEWLRAELVRRLPEGAREQLGNAFARYRTEKAELRSQDADSGLLLDKGRNQEHEDGGGADTFFAWFFRGEGPKGFASGAHVQKRFTSLSSPLATYFDDNHVAELLGCRPGSVAGELARALGIASDALERELGATAQRYLGRAQRLTRAMLFRAAQGGAVELLKNCAQSPDLRERARVLWHELFEDSLTVARSRTVPDVVSSLELSTFFTELRLRPDLRARLWPEAAAAEFVTLLRERELRAQLLAGAARLGHGFIDLYVQVINRVGSLEARGQESDEDDGPAQDLSRINEYLDLLEQQMNTPLADRPWGAFDELSEIAVNYDLILDVNEPGARNKPLSTTTASFGRMLSRQQPVGGMHGEVNATLVRQFRMPGYPFVLITTDLLQEGEDLHTFCSAIHHYGISWTPSSMEQRTGRIDRVRSHAERRLLAVGSAPEGEDLLQVHYPYLSDTIEVLQVSKVLERVNQFLRLMHEGLQTAGNEDRKLDVAREIHRGVAMPPAIRTRLHTAFPVPKWALSGRVREPRVTQARAQEAADRFRRLAQGASLGLSVQWEPLQDPHLLRGTLATASRRQLFRLRLSSVGDYLCVRCTSPVARLAARELPADVETELGAHDLRVTLTPIGTVGEMSLAVEEDILLASPSNDMARVAWLVTRVAEGADELEQLLLEGADQPVEALHAHFAEPAHEE